MLQRKNNVSAASSAGFLFGVAVACAVFNIVGSIEQNTSEGRTLQQQRRSFVKISAENIEAFEGLVQAAEEGSVFVFRSDLRLPSRIVVTKNRLVFRGTQGARPLLRCAEGEGAFRVNANETTFENLEIADCTRTAVTISTATQHDVTDIDAVQENAEQLTVSFFNVNFKNNTETRQKTSSGGISAGKDVNARISGCRFEENRASKGGAVHFAGASLLVDDSSFSKNSAQNGGGAIFAETSHFGDSRAPKLFIATSNFSMNRVLGTASHQDGFEQSVNRQDKSSTPCSAGGAIYASGWNSISVDDSLFSENIAVTSGGAMHLGSNSLTIERCRFIHNVAQQTSWSGSFQQGGALSVFQHDHGTSTTVSESVFIGNEADYGGALHFDGHQGAGLRIIQCRFRHNRATSEGGAVVLTNVAASVIAGSSFVDNSAYEGGALFLAAVTNLRIGMSTVTSRKSVFHANSGIRGGALFARDAGTLVLHEVHFEANHVSEDGGALCVTDLHIDGGLHLQGSRFLNNSARNGGATFLTSIPSVSMTSSEGNASSSFAPDSHRRVRNLFTNNVALAGGAVYYEASHVTANKLRIADVGFFNNSAIADVSAQFMNSLSSAETARDMNHKRAGSAKRGEARLLDIRCSKPCETGGGGALCATLSRVSESAEVTISIANSSFTENSAVVGGAMLVAMDPHVAWSASVQESSSWESPSAVRGAKRCTRNRVPGPGIDCCRG